MGFWNKPPDGGPQDREAQANSELAALLESLSTTATDERPPSPKTNNRSSSATAATAKGEREGAKSAFPTEMNCVSAFDEMYYCYSLGGQFLNVYRYGTLRSCSEKSADWRFCMRTRSYGPVAKKAMIMARYKEKAGKYKTGRSSEEVWEVRTEPLRDAFCGVVDGNAMP